MATIVVRRLCRNPLKSYVRAFSVSRVKSGLVLNPIRFNHDRVLFKHIVPSSYNLCHYATEKKEPLDQKKLTLFQKFKQMYRDYWYVLVPVHIVTSIGWFGSFYYMAKSGIDIVTIMENWHISETLISPLRDSSMGYLAVSYALYKLATPFRYTVTLGGTTLAINYLKNLGYIKPVPSAQELKVMYRKRRNRFMGKRNDVKVKDGGGLKEKDSMIKEKDSMVTGLEKKIKLDVNGTKNVKHTTRAKVKSIKK